MCEYPRQESEGRCETRKVTNDSEGQVDILSNIINK